MYTSLSGLLYVTILVAVTCAQEDSSSTTMSGDGGTTTRPPRLQSYLNNFCMGQTYTLGCNTDDNENVLQMKYMQFNFGDDFTISTADKCEKAVGECFMIVGDSVHQTEDVTFPQVLDLFDVITRNCHNRKSCTGTLPMWNETAVTLPLGFGQSNCGVFGPEFIVTINVEMTCVRYNSTLHTTEATRVYPGFTLPTTTSEYATDEPVVSNSSEPASATEAVTVSSTKGTAEKTTLASLDAKGSKHSSSNDIHSESISAWLAALIVLASIASLAVMVGVCIFIYWLVTKRTTGGKDVTKTSSASELPLNDTTNEKLP